MRIENWIDLNRSDIAWKDAKYAQIWEYLRDEFELTQRFASLDFKLKFVEVKFFSHPRLYLVYKIKLKKKKLILHIVATPCFLFAAQYPVSSGNSSK
jgi:hypothetical protein